MANDRDILDRIDDVIHWDGHSEDAMLWTADPPTLAPPIDPEAARQLLVNLGAQVQAFVDAFRPVAEQVIRTVGEITRAFAGIINTPEMRQLAEAQQLRRRAMKTEYARRNRRRGRR